MTAADRDGPQPLSQSVYRQLREEIVRGTIRPNERLIELELAKRLQISRTPIREALQRLASDGLLVSVGRGWKVREHSFEEVVEIYETRAALEGFAARLAAERASQRQLERIARAHKELRNRRELITPAELVEGNVRFHDLVTDAARNQRLAYQVRMSREFYFNYRLAMLYSRDELRQSVNEHGQILDALRDRDGAAAESAIRRHVMNSLDTARRKLP